MTLRPVVDTGGGKPTTRTGGSVIDATSWSSDRLSELEPRQGCLVAISPSSWTLLREMRQPIDLKPVSLNQSSALVRLRECRWRSDLFGGDRNFFDTILWAILEQGGGGTSWRRFQGCTSATRRGELVACTGVRHWAEKCSVVNLPVVANEWEVGR